MIELHGDKAGSDCPLCVRCKIPSAVAYENHFRTHFIDPEFTCKDCSKTFYESDRLQIHIKRFHSKFCMNFFCYEIVHLFFISHVGSMNFSCDLCGRTFRDKSGMKRHVTGVHLNKRDFTCYLCPKSFSASYNLKEHLFSVHKEASQFYTCDMCSGNFLYRKQFERHREKCDGSKVKRR